MANEREHTVFLGVSVGAQRISAFSSEGERPAFSIEGELDPERWSELATDQLALDPPFAIYACVAVSSGTTGAETEEIVRAGRSAGWDAVLVVSSLLAARQGGERERALRPMVHVDHGISSVGFLRGERLEGHDRIRSIPGREAREIAVSLRCLFKELAESGERLRGGAVVVGEAEEIDRLGRRSLVRELEGLGIRQVEFDPDPYRLARGAMAIAAKTGRSRWRRLRRAQR
ncbi:MAG: hypothetical protein JKY65_11195 [Planctomycetes bacterium]|nr:hypothetical protein [Planctomycetota bacterium]